MEKKIPYRYCMVPCCTNTTIKTPSKYFFRIPNDAKLRKKWCSLMRRNDKKPLSTKSSMHCCEDHFNIEKDVENIIRYRLMGGRLSLRAGVVPHKFDCQKEKKPEVVRTAYEKRRKIEYYKRLLDPNNIPTPAFPDVEFVQIENKDAEKCDETPKLNEDEGNGENEETEKEILMETCSTCLSRDRTIRGIPTDELRKTYHALLRRTDSRRARLCWECEALLERAKNFKKRALIARETLAHGLHQTSVQTSSLSSLCTTTKLDFDLTCAYDPLIRKNKRASLSTVTVKGEDPLIEFNDAPSPDSDDNAKSSYDDLKIEINIKLESDVGVSEDSNFYRPSKNDDVNAKELESDVDVSDDSNLEEALHEDAIFVEVKNEPIAEDEMDIAERSSWLDREKVTLVVGEDGEMYVEVEKDGEVSTEPAVTQIHVNRLVMMELRSQEKRDPQFVGSQYKCVSCIVTFDSEEMLRQHNRSFHVPRAKTKACGVCGSYVLPWCMRTHERAHHTLYKCRLCEMHSRSYDNAIAHVGQWHAECKPPGESYDCEICSESFPTAKQRFKHHVAEHEESGQCNECGFTGLKSILWLHIRLTHPSEMWPCQMCRKAYKCEMQLEAHVKSRHKKRPRSLACEPCDKIFSTLHDYRMHLMHTKRHTTTGRFECTVCRKSYPTSGILKQHQRLKHFDRSICNICHKKLSSASAGKKHIRNVHEGIREKREIHVCEICGILVTNKQQHMQLHTSVPRYACEICGATFKQNASLYKHKRQHLELKMPKQTKKKPASDESSHE